LPTRVRAMQEQGLWVFLISTHSSLCRLKFWMENLCGGRI
jgi:hypothetical protein